MTLRGLSLGARCLEGGACRFRVWAPQARSVEVELVGQEPARHSMQAAGRGYHEVVVQQAVPGTLYSYRLDGGPGLPDPASRRQPHGVHGPSEVVNPGFEWDEGSWRGRPLQEYVFYELHVGAYTEQGTFEALVARLDRLVELGITALELMPVAQFPGERNWGYDGVFPFAVQSSYGAPADLRALVAACHRRGLAVVLDVVYNHLGPEGNYLAEFGPYFTPAYQTAWGPALNFDGPHSDEVRAFFVENALYWLTEFRFDALRLDAVHAIVDTSERPFLAELAEAVHTQARALGRPLHLIAESANNTLAYLRGRQHGGCGVDAQWSDDFHHALHTVLTGEANGYYEDFGSLEQLAAAYRQGFVYTGQYSSYRRRRHGVAPDGVEAQSLVVYAQNHDQTGNRPRGERLSQLVGYEMLKLAAGAVLLSPFLPLLFMGEEHGEEAPFLYFVHHSEPELVEAVRQGRRREAEAFGWTDEPPDPQAEGTFQASRLRWESAGERRGRVLFDFYKELLRLRASPGLGHLSREELQATSDSDSGVLSLQRWDERGLVFVLLNFSDQPSRVQPPADSGTWEKLLDSAEKRWLGPGSDLPPQVAAGSDLRLAAHSLVIYRQRAR